MNDILDIEVILKRQKYGFIYNSYFILLLIIFFSILVVCIYKYKTYLFVNGIMDNGYVKVMVNEDDIKYISLNDKLEIDDLEYNYYITRIDDYLYVDDNYNNYRYLYLKIDGINNLDNYVYKLKFVKENKKIIEYIKDYI